LIVDTRPPRSQQRDKTVYHISISVALSSFDAARHTRRPKLPTALSISQYTRRNCTIHIPIYSRYLKERSSSYSYNQLQCLEQSNCTPSRGAPNEVDVVSRSRRSICYAHVMIAVAARFRLISPIPSLVNRRGNNLHTVDVNTTWYVHREGVPQPQRQGNSCHVDAGVISTLTCCPRKACYFKHSPCTSAPSDTATTCTIVESISSKEPVHVTKRSIAW